MTDLKRLYPAFFSGASHSPKKGNVERICSNHASGGDASATRLDKKNAVHWGQADLLRV